MFFLCVIFDEKCVYNFVVALKNATEKCVSCMWLSKLLFCSDCEEHLVRNYEVAVLITVLWIHSSYRVEYCEKAPKEQIRRRQIADTKRFLHLKWQPGHRQDESGEHTAYNVAGEQLLATQKKCSLEYVRKQYKREKKLRITLN